MEKELKDRLDAEVRDLLIKYNGDIDKANKELNIRNKARYGYK